MAKKHILLYIQIIRHDRDAIKATAIRTLFDFFLVFGLAPFKEVDSAEITVRYIFVALLVLLRNEGYNSILFFISIIAGKLLQPISISYGGQ